MACEWRGVCCLNSLSLCNPQIAEGFFINNFVIIAFNPLPFLTVSSTVFNVDGNGGPPQSVPPFMGNVQVTASAVKSSVNIKSAGGDPKKVAANLPHDGDRALFSSMIGEARGLGTKTESRMEPGTFEQGLSGYFETINPETGEAVASKNAYLPGAIHEQIVQALEAGTPFVRFAFESYVVKGGTAGFTWLHEMKSEGAVSDPLAELRGALGKPKAPAQLPPATKGKGKDKDAA